MVDLVRDYFQRDLNLDELDQLERLLEGPDENADRFAAFAAAFYASLKLPYGPKGARPRMRWTGWVGGLALAGAVSLWWSFHRSPTPPVTPPPASVAVSHPVLAPSPVRPSVSARPVAPPLPPPPPPLLSASAPSLFDGLALELDLPDQGIVTIQVLDSQGQVRRRLFAGVLGPGAVSVKWDGLDDRGRPVEDGSYALQVQQGSYRHSQNVELRRDGGR